MSESSYKEMCIELLRDSGARVTQPRLAVIECLADARHPLSPKQILTKIKQNSDVADIDKVSVYRILEALLKLDLVHQVSPEGKFIACKHIDCSLALHILTRCTVCGNTTENDVPDQVLAPMRWYLQEKLKFEPKEHFIQVDGRCGVCADGSRAD